MRFDRLLQRLLHASNTRLAATRSRARRAVGRSFAGRCRLVESLEVRMVLTTFYVDANLTLTVDRDSSGGLTPGDQVTFGQGQAYEQSNLTYGTAPADGDMGTAFNSIGQALSSPLLQNGDTIDVAGGTYREGSLTIDKSVTLKGTAPGSVFLEPTLGNLGSGFGITITANADNVTIADLFVHGFGNGLSAAGVETLTLRDVALQSFRPITAVFPPAPQYDGISGVQNLNLVSTSDEPAHVTIQAYRIDRGALPPLTGGYIDGLGSLAIGDIGRLSITTGGGGDTFNVSPLFDTAISIDADDPSSQSGTGDALTANLAGVEGPAITLSSDASGASGSWVFANRQPIHFSHIETLTQSSALAHGQAWLNVEEGVDSGNQVVARFTDSQGAIAADYSASIAWGDGSTSAGQVSYDATSGLFSVSGSHIYQEDGIDFTAVTLHRNGYADVTIAGYAMVREAPIVGTGIRLVGSPSTPIITAPDGKSAKVAIFSHGDGREAFANPGSATIDWGDGTTSPGTVEQYPPGDPNAGSYYVTGIHAFQEPGQYAITVTVYDDGNPTTIASQAIIAFPAITSPLTPPNVVSPPYTTTTPHTGSQTDSEAPASSPSDSSPNAAEQPSANERFVAAAFNDLLSRQVDPDGLKYWSAKLDSGASRQEVVAGIQESDEYRHDEINALFQTYLHRDADPDALAADNKLLVEGVTLEQLATRIVSSDEYFQQSGGTNDGFLAGLFQEALHRRIDDGAKTAFEHALSQGATRAQIADRVFASQEYRTLEVQTLYQQTLGRRAEAAGENYWVEQLAHGLRDEQLLAALLGSQEYFDDVTVS